MSPERAKEARERTHTTPPQTHHQQHKQHEESTMATPTTAGRVIIGQGITVKGDIKNCEEVIVRGFFDAGNVEAKTVVVEADGETAAAARS